MENNLPSTIPVKTNGALTVRNLQKGWTSPPNPAATRHILVTWDAPEGELPGDMYVVGLFRKHPVSAPYSRFALSPAPLPAGTNAITFDHSLVAADDSDTQYAVKVNTLRGGSTSFIIIDEIIKWD